MNVTKTLIVLIICVFVHVASIKDDHGKYLEKKHHGKQEPRKVLSHHGSQLTHRHHVKKIKEKNSPDRCRIVCPIISPPPNCFGNVIHPVSVTNSTVRPTARPTKGATSPDSTEDTSAEESTESSEEDTSTPKNATKPAVKPQNKKRSRVTQIGASKKTRKHHIKRFYRLSMVQQKLLLKKLKLANRHGKKAYKFRNFNEYYCFVECTEACEPQINFEPPVELPGDEEDSGSDSYEIGEDTPIEATISPGLPNNFVENGIRPFGPVDFMGLDDFGPTGDLALDPYSVYEEKASAEGRKTGRGHKI